MGPKQSTPTERTYTTQQIKVDHPMFALAQQIKTNQDIFSIKTQIRLANKQQFDQWEKRVKSFPLNDSLMQPISQTYTQQGLCGDSGVATIIYHDYPYLLSDEIQNRKGMNNKLFEQNQLWYLIYTILSAAATYHQKGLKTGDIRPDNVFINENGQVKVASTDSWPGQHTNYQKSFYQKEITYISPQEIKDYQFGKNQQSCNKQLAETFSIGLTVLDAATLTDSKIFYSKGLKFNYPKLEDKIYELNKYEYSDQLTLTIQSLCQVDAEYRLTGRQILHWLRPHEDAIVNLEEFQVDGIPQKMRALIERNERINNQSIKPRTNETLYSQPISTYNPTYIPTTYNQPSTIITNIQTTNTSYNLPQTQYIPSYNPISNYGYEGSLTYSQPQSSYVPTVYYDQSQYQGLKGPSPNTVNLEGHQFTLQKIDQQLQMSRKMFPE